jgi:hypothetical protein
MNKQQAGSIHVVISIVVVTILIGVIGYLFWANFADKSVSDHTKSTSTTSSTSSIINDAVSSDSLKFSEWNVEIPLGSNDIIVGSYHDNTITKDGYGYDVSAADNTIKGCYDGTSSAVPLGTIFRFKADSNEPYYGLKSDTTTWKEVTKVNKKAVILGDNVYYYQTPMQACGDSSTTEGLRANNAQEALTEKLISSLKNIKTID